MQTQKEKLLKSVEYEQSKIDKFKKLIDAVPLELIHQAFPQGYWAHTWIGELEFVLPLDFQLVNVFKEFMSLQFPDWKMDEERQIVWDTNKEAGRFVKYTKHDGIKNKYFMNVEFDVAFRSGQDDSTCVLHQIGTKEVPVYEVTCPEGAEEKI